MTGRPTKLTPEIHSAFIDAIRKGAPREIAAAKAKVPLRTLRRWLATGKKATEGPFLALLAALQEAESSAVIERLERIETAGKNGNWVADRWWLEACYPDHFAKQLTATIAALEKRLANLEAKKR